MLRRLMLVLLAAGTVSAQDRTGAECPSPNQAALEQSAREAVQKREFDVAARRFQAAYSSCPAQRAILLELANAYFMGRHFRQAKDVALQVLRVDSGNAAALEIKGNSEY